MSDVPDFNDDFRDILTAFIDGGVRFVVVGAHALAAHGFPRATGDLDILVEPSQSNAKKVVSALRAFGAPIDNHGVGEKDFVETQNVYQMGVPPRRIDILTSITAVEFADAWDGRVESKIGELSLPFLGKVELLRNKRSTGRPKDTVDADLLESAVEAASK
jgi:hypothetical protein